MTKKADDNPLGIVDSSGLADADWVEINKLKSAYETGGMKALSKAFDELSADPVRALRVFGAFRPVEVREAIRDKMAELGITPEDIREMLAMAEAESKGGSTSKH